MLGELPGLLHMCNSGEKGQTSELDPQTGVDRPDTSCAVCAGGSREHFGPDRMIRRREEGRDKKGKKQNQRKIERKHKKERSNKR